MHGSERSRIVFRKQACEVPVKVRDHAGHNKEAALFLCFRSGISEDLCFIDALFRHFTPKIRIGLNTPKTIFHFTHYSVDCLVAVHGLVGGLGSRIKPTAQGTHMYVVLFAQRVRGDEGNHDKLGEESVSNLYYFCTIASAPLFASFAASRHISLSHSTMIFRASLGVSPGMTDSQLRKYIR